MSRKAPQFDKFVPSIFENALPQHISNQTDARGRK